MVALYRQHFLIWPHSREELDSFISGLNRVHATIKFTSDISDTSCKNYQNSGWKINNWPTHLTNGRPPLSSLYLLPSTAPEETHPLYSQAVRLRTICSTTALYNDAVEKLKNTLRKRGYPCRLIDLAISKAAALYRYSLERSTKNEKQNQTSVPFTCILTFNPHNPPIRHIILNNKKSSPAHRIHVNYQKTISK